MRGVDAIVRSRRLLPLLVLAAALGLRAHEPRFLADLQLRVFDEYQRIAPRAYEPVPVRIVDVDEASLARHGQWPWPRTLVAKLVEALAERGAAAIAFDVVFAEPDRTSPREVARSWSPGPAASALRDALDALPDHDAALADAMRRARVVTGFSLAGASAGRAPAVKSGWTWGGPDPRAFVPRFPGSVASLPILEEAALGNGSFSYGSEPEATVRRVPLVFQHDGQLLPSLAAEAVRVAYGASTYVVRSVGASGTVGLGARTGLTHVRIGRIDVPTDARGRVWVHYTAPRQERFVPAWRVLAGDVDPALLEGHIVFVGTSAAGLRDQRSTPVHSAMPGVAIHAQVAEQILLGHHLARPDWAFGAEFVAMAGIGGLLVLLLPSLGALRAALGALGAIAGAGAASWYAYASLRWLVDPVFPSIVVLGVYLVASLTSYLHSEDQRRRIRDAFGRYLSPELVGQLTAHPERLVLGGERRPLSLLFCDVRGFTTLSERFSDPEALIRLINRFLTPMTELILERRGTIDKYMGDCIMAFWNAPLDDPDHARHACEAALEMMVRLERLNAELAEEATAEGRAHEPLRVGIGINTGLCCVGNMGSEQRFDYSVIGDAVNLASRLEGQSKTYGVDVVIGDASQEAALDLATLELDRIRVKGKLEAVRIHALLGDAAFAATPLFQELRGAHGALLKAYRAQEWDAARAYLEACRALDLRLDALYALYGARIERYRADPPGADWDGVYTALSK